MDLTAHTLMLAKKGDKVLITTPIKNVIVEILDDDYEFGNKSEIKIMCVDEAGELSEEAFKNLKSRSGKR